MEADDVVYGQREYKVRDVLIWNNSGRRKLSLDSDNSRNEEIRIGQECLSFNAVHLFYSSSFVAVFAVAKVVLYEYLQGFGQALIIVMQKNMHHFDFDMVGFTPGIWSVFPALLLASVASTRDVGSRIVLVVGVGKVLKWVLNVGFQQGRPFWQSSKIEMWHCPVVYGFPSGHALLLWLVVAPLVDLCFKKAHKVVALAVSCVLIGLYLACMIGRVYLGTHYPHSLFMGFGVALWLLCVFTAQNAAIMTDRVFMFTEKRVETWKDFLFLLILASSFALVLLFLGHFYLQVVDVMTDPDPEVWAKRAKQGCPGIVPNPRENVDDLKAGLGLIYGWFVAVSAVAFTADKRIRARRMESYGTFFAEDSDYYTYPPVASMILAFVFTACLAFAAHLFLPVFFCQATSVIAALFLVPFVLG